MTMTDVLIIDDEAAVRDALAEDLKKERKDTISISPRTAWRALGSCPRRRPPPTVVLLDLRMPVMDGFEFLDAIQLQPRTPYSVIVLTGHGDADAIKVCYENGVTTFHQKAV